MKRVTMKKVKEMALSYDCNFYKGSGYFYFTPIDNNKSFYSGSVYVFRLNDLDIDRWEDELKEIIKGLS